MRLLLIAGALALAAACSPSTRTMTASSNGCAAAATQPWRPLSGTEFTVEATSDGPDCARAVGTLVVRNAQGEVLWAEAAPSAHIMVLAQARDVASMQPALAEWADASNNTIMATTSALPDWPAGGEGPVSGEFPFYAEPHYDRASYLELRQGNLPLFCYVQGMESMGCLVLRDGALEKVGVQAFPG